MNRKATTIEDVARRAAVSPATVSRALRGHPNVAPSTRRRVERAAKLLNYHPHPAASRLASRRSSVVGVAVPLLDSWYFSSVSAGIEAMLSASGYEMAIFVTGDDVAMRRLTMSSMLKGVDGLILVDVALTDEEAESLLHHDWPVVSVGLEIDGMSSVVIDDDEIAHQATSHLVELGHTSIALLSGTTHDRHNYKVPARRRAGYRRALDDAGIEVRPDLDVSGNFTVMGGYDAMCTLLSGDVRPTAVFSMSDEMAFGALRAVRDHGLRVPDDISIVGVDDHPLSWIVDLTTVQQQVGDHGALGARVLLEQIENRRAPVRVEAQASLVLRRSTATPS